MKLITFSSFKGGAGKTTALMGICCALAARGHAVALFEADQNRPLSRWQENSVAAGCWDERCAVFTADELAVLEEAYGVAETRGYDFALADTAGGASELNNTLIASADFLIIPSMLTSLDVDETLATYRYVIELLMAEKLDIPTAVLKQRVPVGRLTISQTESRQVLDALPGFSRPMYERDVFAALKQRGMLHLMIETIEANPAMRVQLRNHTAAMDEMDALAGAILDGMGA